jgi:hypothetical protein
MEEYSPRVKGQLPIISMHDNRKVPQTFQQRSKEARQVYKNKEKADDFIEKLAVHRKGQTVQRRKHILMILSSYHFHS